MWWLWKQEGAGLEECESVGDEMAVTWQAEAGSQVRKKETEAKRGGHFPPVVTDFCGNRKVTSLDNRVKQIKPSV